MNPRSERVEKRTNLTMDIQMMALLSGRERSESDWSELFWWWRLEFIGSVQTGVSFTLVDGAMQPKSECPLLAEAATSRRKWLP